MFVELNAKRYVVVPQPTKWPGGGRTFASPVRHYHVPHFSQFFNVQGTQTQAGITTPTAIFGSLIGGMGLGRLRSEDFQIGVPIRRFMDAPTCDTRWSSGIYLGLLAEDATETGLENSIGAVDFEGSIWTLWADDTQRDIFSMVFNGSAWVSGGTVNAAAGTQVTRPLSVIAHADRLIALLIGGFSVGSTADNAVGDDHVIFFDVDGAGTWTGATTQPSKGLLNADVAAGDTRRAGMLVSLGELNEAAAVLWNENTKQINIYSERGTGAVTWTTEVNFTSGNGVLGVAAYPGLSGSEHLYVLTVEGLWDIDCTIATWTANLVRRFNSVNVQGGALANGDDGKLWISEGVSESSPASTFTMEITDSQTRHFELVPNDLSFVDEIPSDLLGPIRVLHASGGFMYASAGGGETGRKARILCHNGYGWHTVYAHGTENQRIDWLAISNNGGTATERLHFGIRTASTTTDAQFLSYPNANPEALSGTIKRATTGYVDLPFIDGGMPTVPATWLQAQLSATGLTTTSLEFVNVDYALLGGTRGGTNLGDFASVLTNLDFASGAGVESRALALRLNMSRDAATNTNNPRWHNAALVYLKSPSARDGFEFIVDLEATSALPGHSRMETVHTNLDAAHDSVTLVTLKYAPKQTASYVKVVSVDYVHEVREDGGPIPQPGVMDLGQRGGYVIVRCEEQVG